MCKEGKHYIGAVGTMTSGSAKSPTPVCRGCDRERRGYPPVLKRKPWLRADSYDLDTGQPIIDDIAIEAVVNGDNYHFSRGVKLTYDEFKIALGVLVDRGEENEVIANYIGGGITVREAGVAVKTLYTQRRRCGESTPGSGAWRSKTLERWYSERLNPLIVQRMRRERIA